jgi:ornithine carbamoyltransferase
MKRLISIQDLTGDALHELVVAGCDAASGALDWSDALRGKCVGLYFSKASTRTRTSFFAAIERMGGASMVYSSADLQTTTGESLEDTGMCLGLYLDALVMRTNGCAEEMVTISESGGGLVVVNALSKTEHPTQAIADLITIRQEFGTVEGRRVLYLGTWNNTVASLVLALTKVRGTETIVMTPKRLGPDEGLASSARRNAEASGASVRFVDDPQALPRSVDVVYTVRWQSMGEEPAAGDWRSRLNGFEVNAALWARVAHHRTIFMHDLPAHRGLEVEAGIIDGPASRVRRQAYNKMIAAMCVLERCLRRQPVGAADQLERRPA